MYNEVMFMVMLGKFSLVMRLDTYWGNFPSVCFEAYFDMLCCYCVDLSSCSHLVVW